jgi:hypothetical protein
VLPAYQAERLQVRLLHVLLSAGTILIIYYLTEVGFGKRAAVFASAFVASCQFHIHFSRTVIQTAPLLFFAALSLYFFYKSAKERDDTYLLLTGASLGVAYLCEETAAFLLLAFVAFLLFSGNLVRWLKKWQTFLARALFVIIIAPDLYWNMTAERSDIGFHLARAARLHGLSLLPSSLFVGELLSMWPKDLEAFIGGFGRKAVWNVAYPTLHWVFGLLCILSVALSFRRWKDPFTRLMIITFSVVFLFFTFAASGRYGRSYNFWWASIAFIPAVVLTGQTFSRLFEKRIPGKVLSLVIVMYLFGHAVQFLEIRDPVYVRRPTFLAGYYREMGRRWLLRGNCLSAIDNFGKSLQFDQSSIPVLVNMAECYRRRGNALRAQDALEKAERSGLTPSREEEYLVDTGYIKVWTIGPVHKLSGGNAAEAARQAGDASDLRQSPKISWLDPMSWKVQSPSAFVDLTRLSRNRGHVCTVVRTRIYSPLRRNIRMLVGADDGMTVWLNGKEIYCVHEKNVWFPDEDVITVELNEEWNDLMLGVTYGAGSQYGFSMRILDEAGAAMHDLKYEAPGSSKLSW